jgi:TonB family protein
MSDMWKKWEGQVADHKYQLKHYLGSTDHSVVFLAEFHDPGNPEPQQVAIKFISAEVAHRDQQISAWKNAAELNHPNLLQIHGGGLCRIEDTDLLYVATEYAEENLAQVLPHRALTKEEATETLKTVADVLLYLHGKDLTHGHVKPSNILAIGESMKLSSDTIYPLDQTREMRRERSAYDAPELPDSAHTPAADVWSLGVTLVEAFTQQPAVLPFNEEADPIIPPAVKGIFLEIVRHALQRDPKLRWSSAQISERLNPATAAKSVAAGAGTSVSSAVAASGQVAVATPVAAPAMSPLSVPLSKEPAVPMVRRVAPSRAAERLRSTAPARQTVVLPNYVLPLFAGFLVLIALIVLPFALRHRTAPQASLVKIPAAASSTNVAATRPSPVPSTTQPAAKITPPKSDTPPPAATTPHIEPPTASTPSPTVSRDSASSVLPPSPKNASSSPAKGEALDQIAPKPSAKALSTIQGTVRVAVKVHVDTAGNVAEATLDNSGPSKYFADLALKAARQWVFTPPETNGRSVPSDWLIQFHFTQSGVQMTSQQQTP